MPAIINSDDGVVSGSSGLKTSGANDGILNLQTNGSTAMSINASQQVTFNNGANLPNTFGFKNRIINGGMVIAQRGTSASPTSGGYFTVDRWRFGQASSYAASLTPTISQSSVAPSGFANSFLYTNGTGAAPTSPQLIAFDQYIEGLNCADLEFGSASAATVTVSFWVRASVTGTYAVSLANSDINRSYVATYTINAANTWEQKSVTIAGDTSGTWLKTNGIGIAVRFAVGGGSGVQTTAGAWQAGNFFTTSACTNLTATSGATFYITGVQLERGSTATSFDFRPYGTELMLCQRYLPALNSTSTTDPVALAFTPATTIVRGQLDFKVTPRTPPTGITVSSASHFSWDTGVASGTPSAISFTAASSQSARFALTVTGATAGNAAVISFSSASGQILFTGCEL